MAAPSPTSLSPPKCQPPKSQTNNEKTKATPSPPRVIRTPNIGILYLFLGLFICFYLHGTYVIPHTVAADKHPAEFLIWEAMTCACFAGAVSTLNILLSVFPEPLLFHMVFLSVYGTYVVVMFAVAPRAYYCVGVSVLVGVLFLVPVLVFAWWCYRPNYFDAMFVLVPIASERSVDDLPV